MISLLSRLLCQIETEAPPAQFEWGSKSMKSVALLLAVAFFLLYITRRHMIRRRGKQKMISSPVIPSSAIPPREMYDQLNNLMAELVTLSRQINGEIDTRCSKLNFLLREADQKIARLEKLQGLPPSQADDVTTPADREFKIPAAKNREPARGYNDVAKNYPPAGPGASLSPEQVEENSQTLQILALAAKGMSPVTIAKTLNRHVGEIQLILSLHHKK